MFKHLLQTLPTRAADMALKSYKVPLLDLECVTNTLVKLGGPTWYLNIKKGEFCRCLVVDGVANVVDRGEQIRR